jgi:hypothetical protein
VFYFAYNYINFNPNHMIESVSERQDVIILHILSSDYYVISSIYTASISAKWPNIGTVFWATVHTVQLNANTIKFDTQWSTKEEQPSPWGPGWQENAIADNEKDWG